MRLRLAMRALAGLLLALGVFPLANWLTGGRAVPWFTGAAAEWALRGMVVLLIAGASWRIGGSVDRVLDRARSLMLQPSAAAFGVAVAVAASFAAAAYSEKVGIGTSTFRGLKTRGIRWIRPFEPFPQTICAGLMPK